ncbi:hypothetical protein J8273_6791 [Carpediemonas membranifera]|uniref:Uncharacterized protein n=1 Tax=Carpediemonas membranifera TaxID=201153 RepID=A0A8J6AR87_9EUKA|nr:hypothetical protein J8273_6791 [Carpediemonas membranifera]|eukprot:KAG9391903.1 hypothetical protein J8273_6791 [Carpediemonas membranifera]
MGIWCTGCHSRRVDDETNIYVLAAADIKDGATIAILSILKLLVELRHSLITLEPELVAGRRNSEQD